MPDAIHPLASLLGVIFKQIVDRRKLVLSWAKHKQRIDLPCAKEKSAKSKSWKCSDINTEWEENYGDDKTYRA